MFKGPGPGRPKGVPNKMTMAAKEAIQFAFDGLGGADGLIKWAKKNDLNKRVFYGQIYPKLLPLDVKHSGEIQTLTDDQLDAKILNALAQTGTTPLAGGESQAQANAED